MRPEKESMTKEMRGYVADAHFVFLVDHTGLNVRQVSELRHKLGDVGAELHVVRNRLLKIVTDDLGWADDMTKHLVGPTAIVAGRDDVATAKVLKDFAAADKRPVIKAGMTDGTFLAAGDIREMADLPSLEVMRGRLASVVAAPMTYLVSAMSQKLSSLVYVLKAVEEKKTNA